jgi:hypothetical protein
MANVPHMFEQEVQVNRPARILLGAVLVFGFVFFGGLGVFLLAVDRSTMPYPLGVLVIGGLFLVLASAFGLVAWRLVRMHKTTDYLFGPRFNAIAAKAMGPCMAAIGLVLLVVSGVSDVPKELMLLSIFVAVSGTWFSWKAWRG